MEGISCSREESIKGSWTLSSSGLAFGLLKAFLGESILLGSCRLSADIFLYGFSGYLGTDSP